MKFLWSNFSTNGQNEMQDKLLQALEMSTVSPHKRDFGVEGLFAMLPVFSSLAPKLQHYLCEYIKNELQRNDNVSFIPALVNR